MSLWVSTTAIGRPNWFQVQEMNAELEGTGFKWVYPYEVAPPLGQFDGIVFRAF